MITQFLQIVFAIFIVVDPLGLVPLYIGLAASVPLGRKKRIVTKAILISFIVLGLFVAAGKWILTALGIQPGAFFVAGGVMLFIVSLEMLFGRPTQTKVSLRETHVGADEDIAVFPLAIPMLAGPGTMTTIILLTTGSKDEPVTTLMLLAAIALTLAVTYGMLRASDYILRVLGKTGVSVIERIMGLLLSGLSIQFVYDGVVKLGLVS